MAKTVRLFALTALGSSALAVAAASDPASPAPPCIVVRAARLIDGRGGAPIERAFVRIAGDRIVEAGAVRADRPAPANCRLIDLGGATLLPGLIDLHTHLTGNSEHYWEQQLLEETPALAALYGAGNARKVLEAGFTTCRDVGATWPYTDVDLKRAIDEGVVPGPRLAVAGAYITTTAGGGDASWFTPYVRLDAPDVLADNADEVRKKAREHLKHGAGFLKIIASGAVLSQGGEPGAPAYTEEEIRAAVEVAAANGTYVAAHAHGAESILRALRAGARTIEHGTLLDDAGIALLLKTGACYVPNFYVDREIQGDPVRWHIPPESVEKEKAIMPLQYAGWRKALAAGVKTAFGTDIFEHGLNGREFRLRVDAGESPMHAIQSATSIAAECMGWADRVGAIEAGKFADLVAVAGDPLADISELERVSWVMKGGRVVSGERR